MHYTGQRKQSMTRRRHSLTAMFPMLSEAILQGTCSSCFTRCPQRPFQEALMKNIGKLAVLGAVLAASSSFAFGDTIVATSWGTLGYAQSGVVTTDNTAMHFVGDITYGSSAAMLAAVSTTHR